MSDLMTHVVAILVGVGITLCLVGAYNNATTATASSSSSKNNTSSKTTTTSAAAGGGGGNKSKRNKKKNKKSTATATVASPPQSAFENVPAIPDNEPVVAVVVEKKAAAAFPPQQNVGGGGGGGGGGKKKKKNKKMTVVKSSSTASTIPSANLTNTEPTPQKSKPKVKTPVVSAPIIPSEGPGPLQPRIIVEEEWATIPVQKKKNKKMKQPANGGAANGANGATTAPAVVVSERVTIDSSRVGIIIGPKGATMNAIQEKTGVKLDVNAPKLDDAAGSNGGGNNQFRPVRGGSMKKQTATVIITGGTNESRVIAKKAILELADRGYSSLLMGDQFGESTVTVHPRFLSNIVGPGGKIIKLIQSECNVKLTIPKNVDWTPKTIQVGNVLPTCRVGIAGDDVKNVKLAKQVIKDLCTYHYHSITHPGFTHQELYVPQEFFHCVIGPRGSEIKHIRGNYKVDVYIPNNESITENIICVGKSNDVEKAISYIKLLMERDTELREAKYSDEQYGNNDADGW
ncbi:hypothetical protein FRACYDRAFT_263358 [Fragilariopsis cylindrus CCMP1102]|uniref:K Homology domain-containing protein n=1 Tax=Fragilariopsis cylindrus CCMP1102 TaxID=635003 RepID=A0A1E7F1B3_9STRA|nr:hypothetical protein FRACYDRAFT_263358 [Fragilariopsis cylindrus CCMP1102]|eukprot:OEU11982.1 hypothetical protein FRACYDRAFT_263358 [Fragilariopsis cylindrus CCMP1102]